VRPGLDGSYEEFFHNVGVPDFLLFLETQNGRGLELPDSLLERAIGVIYLSKTERWSHYFHAQMRDQFNAVIHFDQTRAVEPLEPSSEWRRGELPETYPFGV
jgi:erythromycin esterase-like protein